MAGINQQQLIGSMIPDVYIKKISLESGGMTLKKENPHIRHPHENANKLATSNNDMNVRLDLSIKDMHDTGLVDTWFANQDYKKYLKLTVIQSLDPLVTKILAASNNAIRIANFDSEDTGKQFLTELVKTIKDLPIYKSENLSIDKVPELLQRIQKNTTIKHLSFHEISRDNSLLSQQ